MRGAEVLQAARKISCLFLLFTALLGSACSAHDKGGHKFLTKAIEDGLAEIRLCKLALGQSESEEVKSFARRIIKDHADINQELVILAEEKGLKAPLEPSDKQKSVYDRLARLSGPAFDKEFVKYNVSDHETDVQDFRREAEIGSDQEVKNLAAKALKVLQVHLQISRDLAQKIRASR
jgi:putative membrane protein